MSEVSVIIDNGTNTIKAGFSDDDMPRAVIPTILGKPSTVQEQQPEEQKDNKQDDNDEDKNEQLDIFVGEEALNKGGTLDLIYPIEMGEIKDYDSIELIWKHIFYNELLAEPKKHSVIVTEAPFASYENRKKMAEILFNNLGVEKLYITNNSTLALFANGKTTGTVVDIGYGTTSFVPVYEGFALNHAVTHVEIGGKDLTDFFCKIIGEHKPNREYKEKSEKAIINDLKEKICEVAEDYDSQIKKCMDSNSSEAHQLPDGSVVYINQEKYKCPELLFQPQLDGQRQNNGLHEETYKSIKKCDEDIEKDLFQNVVLCGGSSLFLKTRKKFEKELQSLAPTGKTVKVIAPPERRYSSWLGGAILSSMENFRSEMFVTKKEWNENENVIYDKFF
ncbi:MAG: actin family protein [archaeon]|nr:actin family protein [archaeon]